MADQKTMNGRNHKPSAGSGFGRSMADFAHDLLSLGELQLQLLQADLRDGRAHCRRLLLLAVTALVVGLGAVPVCLLGVGWLLVDNTGLSAGIAIMGTGMAAILMAAGLAWFAWRQLKNTSAVLSRSGHEIQENIHWIKQALKARGTKSLSSGSTFHHRTSSAS